MADPIKQFVIKPIVPFEIAGVDLSFTNSSLWMVIAAVTSAAFLLFATRKRAMIPDRLQAASEGLYEFIASMIKDNTGPEGRRYFPFIFTIFMVVLMGNMLGLIPGSFTYTSHIAVTLGLAMLVFFAVTILGIINHGTHFFELFAPPGVPKPLLIIMVPIELASYMIRPFTLSFRLFANMMAGHLMLKVFAGFSTMMVAAGIGGVFLGFVPALFNVALYALELLVALLQAYVFAILTSIYLKDTLDIAH